MAGRKRALSPQPAATRKSSRRSIAPVKLGFDTKGSEQGGKLMSRERETSRPLPEAPEGFEMPSVELPEIVPAHTDPPHEADMLRAYVETNLREYNALLDFLPRNATTCHEEDHHDMQKSRNKVQRLYDAYTKEMAKLIRATHCGIGFITGVVSTDRSCNKDWTHWYANASANLMSLDLNRMKNMIKDNPITDSLHFQQYLVRILPEYLIRIDGDDTG